MKNKILNLQAKMSQGLVGRDEIIKIALLGLIAKENVLLIGPPGTGKSMVARRLHEALTPATNGQSYFEYLLTKFSTPEELFGPLSIAELKKDRFVRNTQGFLPTVDIAFLDEIFKASSSILNSLLTILNERKFHNGTQSETVPLQTIIAASNELPNGQPELSALYDRFLLRRYVGYLETNQLDELFELPSFKTISNIERLSLDEIELIRARAEHVTFPQEIQDTLKNIWKQHQEIFKDHADESLSDRRFVKVLHLLKVSAASNERNEVDFSDVLLLKDCLWNNEANTKKVQNLINQVIKTYTPLVDVETEEISTAIPDPRQSTTSIIKGYQGSGTADDPILIKNLNHLQGLSRPEVGQKGYHFLQTHDIDCSVLKNSWLNIKKFVGFYDGGGHSISYNPFTSRNLFNELKSSEVVNLKLDHVYLANIISNSKISACYSNTRLLYSAQKVTISNCVIKAMDLVNEESYENTLYFEDKFEGLIAHTLAESQVSNCLILFQTNQKHQSPWFNAIARYTTNCMITSCFTYIIKKSQSPFSIALKMVSNPYESDFQNNYSFGDSYGHDRYSIHNPISSLTQYFFENTMHWDFNKFWDWDNSSAHPILRNVVQKKGSNIAIKTNTINLLQQQLNANIWLS